MTDHRLDYAAHISAVEHNTGLLLADAHDALGEQVPTCPGWTVADLVEHLGNVFGYWRAQLESATPEEAHEPANGGAPAGVDPLERLAEASERLEDTLTRRDPGEPCWNWSGGDLTARWVARRMALECAIHRVDGGLAIGAPTIIERDLAIDGIDERLAVHLATDAPEHPEASLGGVLCLACDDDPAAWTVEVAGGRLRWREGRGPADAVLVGSASDLFLFTWNRISPEGLQLTGSHEVAAAWRALPT